MPFYTFVQTLICGMYLLLSSAWANDVPSEVSVGTVITDGKPFTAQISVTNPQEQSIEVLSSLISISVDGEQVPRSDHVDETAGYSLSLIRGTSESGFLILAFDISRSVEKNAFESGLRSGMNIIEHLPLGWRASVVTFGDSLEELSTHMQDAASLKKIFSSLSPDARKTLLYDGLYQLPHRLRVQKQQKIVLLLFTDGIDDGSYITSEDCIQMMRELGIVVVIVDQGKPNGRGSVFLQRMAAVSMGQYVQAGKDLDPMSIIHPFTVFPQVLGVVSFDHSKLRETGFHELTVTLVDTSGIRLGRTSKIFFVGATPAGAKSNHTLVVGMIVVILILLSLVVFFWVRARPQKLPSGELGDLRVRIKKLQEDARAVEEQVLGYGGSREEKLGRWRDTCFNTARKAVVVLKSCWLERENPLGELIYDELVSNMKTVGVEEINPKVGAIIDETDRRYWIRKKSGGPPFKLVKVLYPGYYFRPRVGDSVEDEVLLEPAQVEIAGDQNPPRGDTNGVIADGRRQDLDKGGE